MPLTKRRTGLGRERSFTMTARSTLLLGLCYAGFVSLGLPDGVLGVAWPSVRAAFDLPLDALAALLITTTVGYVSASFASGWLLQRMSVGGLLAWSCLATSLSLLGYAAAPLWGVMVALGLAAGVGAGAIDAGINTFAATHYSARTVNLLHAFYGLGAAAGPLIMTSVMMAGLTWRRGYLLIGTAQLVLALGFALTRRLWRESETKGAAAVSPAPVVATLRLRGAQLASLVFFLYVGMEATAGIWIYSLLGGGRGFSMAGAGTAVSVFWGGLMLGRLLFGLLPQAATPERWLRGCMAVVAACAMVLALDPGAAGSVAAIALFGCAAGPIFPLLIATTPGRIGTFHTANAVGFQVAFSAAGLSIVPALVGVLADRFGLEAIPLALLGLAALLMVLYRLLEAQPLPETSTAQL